MSLTVLAAVLISAFVTFLARAYTKERAKTQKLTAKTEMLQKNQDYLMGLIKDIQDVTGYGSDMGNVIEVITKSLDTKLPYATLSSLYIKGETLIFSSQVKESVSHAFVSRIKDAMLQSLTSGTETFTPPNGTPVNPPPAVKTENVEEHITGAPLDDLARSEIKSSIEIRLTVNAKTEAVINISSTNPDVYTEEDKRILSAISVLVSDYLTRLHVLLGLEKSKSLAMIDSFTDGIFMIDRDGNLAAMNDSAIEFLNIHNKPPTFNDVLSALPNTYNFKDKIEQVIAKNEPFVENDVSINGKIFKINITPVLEISMPGESVIGASVLLKDITVEKSLEQLREDFTNVMVHELRSPLTAIKASSEFLMSQAELTPEEKKRLTEMIAESTHKMLDKISLILDSAKLESGLFTLKKTQADLKKLITDRIAVFTPVAQEKEINLKVDVDPNIPTFSFDPIRIDEVVNNLLSNSLKFTPEHGTITLQAMLSQDKVLVSVTDTGAGIPKDKQGKLFAKYQQAPTDGQHVGTGLGLYVVKEIVEDHGGTVSLISDEGKGTTITFTLPLHPAVTAPKPADGASANPQKLVN